MLYLNSIAERPQLGAKELKDHIGETVSLHAMVYKIREMSGFAFVLLRTLHGMLQGVYAESFSDFPLSLLKENMSILARGEVVAEERSRLGAELRLRSVTVLSAPAEEPPLVLNNKKMNCSLETLLDYRPITVRNEKESAVFKLQAGLCRGLRAFFDENDFTEIHSPKIVYSGAEGGANIFSLDYFGKQAFLAQSPQFYKQMMVGAFERVYEIAPVFRAEKHDTSRHLNEYTGVDFEMGFIESFYDLCRMETGMLAYAFAFLKNHYAAELSLLGVEMPVIGEIPCIKFEEAKQLVSQTFRRPITDFEDFEPEEEKLLCQLIKRRENSDFVFVTHYRSSKRPFYAMDTPSDPTVTESFDLLFRGMEVTTGGQRIHNYAQQVEKMKLRGMDPARFGDFLMAHRYGLPPHGGLGLGLERLTAKLLGFQNVRNAALFPRDIHRLTP
ncbi:aspartate--tRNA(Asn) ligase [Acidaminobacterium chupaoyuni]